MVKLDESMLPTATSPMAIDVVDNDISGAGSEDIVNVLSLWSGISVTKIIAVILTSQFEEGVSGTVHE